MKFALIYNNQIREYREYAYAPACKYIDGKPVLRPVVESAQPTYNAQTQTLAYDAAIFDDRVEWTWRAVDLPPSVAQSNINRVEDQLLQEEVSRDFFVKEFVGMNFNQVQNYIDNNVTDLASAKQVLKHLAKMILLMAKIHYR